MGLSELGQQATRLSVIDMHTAGEPVRIFDAIELGVAGKTILEKRRAMGEQFDHLRRAMMLEPRGHADMYAGYLTEPVSAQADFGVIFVHNEGYSDHCGHGVIALATAAVELGWVKRTEPETRVGIDAPCGFIEAFVTWDGKRAASVRFVNVPSYLVHREISVETPSFGRVTGDIAFGGAFYFYTDGRPFGLAIRRKNAEALIRFGAEVKIAANKAFPVVHPDIPELNHIYGTIIDGDPLDPKATQANCCIFADRQLDRSPTGSGTAGRTALLHAKGLLKPGELLVNESIVGSIMTGRVLQETKLGEIDAIIPEVSGSAHLCGQATWFIDRNDPLRHGFLLR